MDDLKTFKEKQINEYLSNNLNFENPEQISSIKVRSDLKPILGEEPGIKFNYRKENLLNEVDGKIKSVEMLESISIVFTYVKTISDGKGGYIDIPVPVEKEFQIS